MSEREPPTLEDSFLESNDTTIKLIAEFVRTRTKKGVEEDVTEVAQILREEEYAIHDVRMDDGVTPFAVLELPMTNVMFESVVEVHKQLVEIRGFEGLTISTVDVGGITRFSQKR